MIYKFEGRTEKEAIDRAAAELGLQRDCFDVEIMETQKGGLFKKGFVKIQVHTSEPVAHEARPEQSRSVPRQKPVFAAGEFEQSMIDYVQKIITLMGIEGSADIQFREKNKFGIKIETEASSFLIGRKGKTLDSLQLIVNIYAGRLGHEDMRIVLDCENYRVRREEALVRLAYSVAERVRNNRGSMLLEPMNPFDRRLIHTTISDISEVETKSEGEGMYKQVRVFFTG